MNNAIEVINKMQYNGITSCTYRL